jgi:hypothetical protein
MTSAGALAVDLVLLAIGLAVALRPAALARRPRARRAIAAAALLLALGSYLDFGRFVRGHLLNLHDLYHHWFAAKYAPELGYRRLYHCTLVALAESEPRALAGVTGVRSMVHYGFAPKEWFLARPERCKRHFSAARWAEFRDDLRAYRDEVGGSTRTVLRDKGFNATPVWTWIAHPLASAVPMTRGWRLDWLAGLDLALLAAALAAVGRAFGARSACLVAIWIGGCFALSAPHVRGGFLRMDWLAASLFGVACLERRRPATAGAFFAWAAMVRVVPVLLLAVPAAQALRALSAERRLPRAAARLFAGFAATCALLFALSLTGPTGLDAWRGFASKIAVHDADVSPLRVGAKALVTWRGETSPADYVGADGRHGYRPHFVAAKRALYATWRPVLLALALAAAFAAAAWLPAGDAAAGVALAFPVVFLAATPTFYYWAFLAVPVAVLAARGGEAWARHVLASLFAAAIAVQLVRHCVAFEWSANALHSAVLAAACVASLAIIRSRARAAARAATA